MFDKFISINNIPTSFDVITYKFFSSSYQFFNELFVDISIILCNSTIGNHNNFICSIFLGLTDLITITYSAFHKTFDKHFLKFV